MRQEGQRAGLFPGSFAPDESPPETRNLLPIPYPHSGNHLPKKPKRPDRRKMPGFRNGFPWVMQ